jgi:hypothetical protein
MAIRGKKVVESLRYQVPSFTNEYLMIQARLLLENVNWRPDELAYQTFSGTNCEQAPDGMKLSFEWQMDAVRLKAFRNWESSAGRLISRSEKMRQ